MNIKATVCFKLFGLVSAPETFNYVQENMDVWVKI